MDTRMENMQLYTEIFRFTGLHIEPSEIEELMGFEPGQSPAPFPGLIEEGLRQAPEYCRIEGGYKIFSNFSIDIAGETLRVENQVFRPGKIVITQLKKATQAALFICTAGPGITELSKQKSAEGDELMAYVYDVIGSVTVDKAAGQLKERLLEEVSAFGFRITDSFSPGYCDWNVDEQQKLFSLLPAGFCNIRLLDSSLMHPVKSVSGITGIGIHCEQKGYQCNWCNDSECMYGKIRRNKNAKKKL